MGKSKIMKWIMLFFPLMIINNTIACAEIFKVGVVMSLTGPLARGGNNFYQGIEAGVELFNRESPDHKIELVTIDDESKPANSVAALEQLNSQGVVGVLGGASSDIVVPTATVANRIGLLYMTSGGGSSELVNLGYNTLFRLNNVRGYATAMKGMMIDKMPDVKKVSIIYSTRSASSEAAEVLVGLLNEANIEVISHAFDPNIRDFKPIVNKIKLRDKSDVILMVAYENDYIGILRAAKILKPNVKALIGTWYITTVQMAKDFPDLLENVFGVELLSYPVEFEDEYDIKFSKIFQELNEGKTPDYVNVYGFVLTQILSEALVRAHDNGTLNNKRGLINEVRKTDRMTLIGQVEFDDRGETLHYLPKIAQHQNGKIVLVWPDDTATGEIKYPALPW